MQMNVETTEVEGLHAIPVGDLGIAAMRGCEELAGKVNTYLNRVRSQAMEQGAIPNTAEFADYVKDDYCIDVACPRFGSGEGKGIIKQSVRGTDLFILCDTFNYGVTYRMYGKEVVMSPDDHYQDIKRVICAAAGKARRINVIMPMLYEGRQHRRTARESLDCAVALQELVAMGVDNIITFDAHDSRVHNAIPMAGFENVQPAYQMIKAMVNNVPNLHFDRDHMMVISPDEGGMSRCIFYSTVLGVPLGMFYKRRDYTRIVNGRNPIVKHEFLGESVEGKDLIIVDDMISSGDSVLDIANQLKAKNAGRIFVCTSFGLFTEGLASFDEAYEKGLIEKVFTTNLIYRTEELRARPWYCEVDMSKYIAYLINNLNHDLSLSELLDPSKKIHKFLGDRGLA